MSEETSATAEKPTKRRGGNHNPTGRNQWAKLQSIEDSAEREARLDAWRERFKAGALIERLVNHGDGGVDLKPSQVKALEIVLDRLEPRLSAVEQTNVNPDEAKSPLELLQELAPLLKAHPEWLRSLGFVPLEPVKEAEAAQQQTLVSAQSAVNE